MPIGRNGMVTAIDGPMPSRIVPGFVTLSLPSLLPLLPPSGSITLSDHRERDDAGREVPGEIGIETFSEGELDAVDLSTAHVLLVDDNLQNLELVQAYLEALPCRLTVATDGVEAITAVERDRPDLILLDVMMPRMSGFEVCRRIKGNPETRGIVVVMLTALNEVADYERAVESGTDDFLSKPVNKLELITRIRSLLRVSLLRRRLDELLGRHAPGEA